MSVTADPQRLFTERHEIYERFIRAMRYPQGLRTFFLSAPILRTGLRVLEAGCGTGALTLAIYDASVRRGTPLSSLHAFDLTPAMLDRLRAKLEHRGIEAVELAQADVLHLDALPDAWHDYDLIVSASMLEYVPRERFVEVLRGLRARLNQSGRFVLLMTRRNLLTRMMIGRWWQSNLYSAGELADAFERAGFSKVGFLQFPLSACHLSLWGHVVEARR